MRAFLVVVLLSASSAWAGGRQGSSSSTPASDAANDKPTVFSVSTTLVQVDAEVTDSKGRHVTDLKPEDFEVTLDKKSQAIANFSYVKLDDGKNGLPPAASMVGRSVASSYVVRPENVRRSMVFVVDDLGLSFESTAFVRQSIRDFIDKKMAADDLVAVWETGHSNSVFQQLTSDKHLLDAAADSLRWDPREHELRSAFQADDNFVGNSGAPNTERLANPDDSQANRSADLTKRDGKSRDLSRRDDENAYIAASSAGNALDVIGELADELAEVGGRKAVVFFADGLYIPLEGVNGGHDNTPLGTMLWEKMRKLVDKCNRSGTVLYAVDTRGLQYYEPDAISAAGGIADTQQAMQALTEPTGGFAALNTNDITGAIAKIQDDQRGYYLIGFKAPDHIRTTADGKPDFHSLHVRVKRPGLHLRSRQGFYGETDAAARPQYNTPLAQMRLAALSLFNRSDIHVRMTALYSRTADGRPAVRNMLYIDLRDVTFKTNPKGEHQADLDLLVTATGPGLEKAESIGRHMQIVANDAKLADFMKNGVMMTLDLALKKTGPYQVRASVRDGYSSKLGSAGEFLAIPDVKKQHLALTTPIVRDASTVSNPADPSLVLREFHAGSTLTFVSVLETDRDDSEKASGKDLRGGIQLYSGGKPILNAPVTVADVQGSNVHALKGKVLLNNALPPGQYYLEATATDASGKAPYSTTSWIDFQIVP